MQELGILSHTNGMAMTVDEFNNMNGTYNNIISEMFS